MVEVNGAVVTEMGYQVKDGDKVTYAGERLSPEKPVYILMNKPKDYITTAKDPEGRRTVMSLLRGIGDARVFPVGRLDRHTTGLLLLTNDGGLAKKLTHPTHGVKKLYHVHLDKTLKAADMRKLVEGVDLEDGPMKVDEISYVNAAKDKKQVGVEIHSGKNRVVRRLFAHLGYEVVKLDRVLFAGLSKKDLPRGKWRHLSTQELSTLKMLK
jgi:23S rRNA pseudouridine2605 synthase